MQRATQPQRPQSEVTALIPSWARQQRPSPAILAQQSSSAIGEAIVSDTVLPEEQERRKRSANVVMYGLLGDSSACLRQAVQEVFQALNLPHAGQHVVAVEPLPTQAPTHLGLCASMTLAGAHACYAPSAACGGSLHWPGCTLLSISPGPNRLRDPQGSPGLLQRNNWPCLLAGQ